LRNVVFFLLLSACNSTPTDINYTSTIKEQTYTNISTIRYDPCPDDMVYINRKAHSFCIDRYEAPDQKGVFPISAINAHEAENLCASVNKRICLYDEWYNACVGRNNLRYSYGNSYVAERCNDSKTGWVRPKWELMSTPNWKTYAKTLYKADKSGSHPLCKSDEGVYDLLGNVREWTKDPKSQYGYVIPASYFYGTMTGDLSCNYVIKNHFASFGSYEFGARCCKDIR